MRGVKVSLESKVSALETSWLVNEFKPPASNTRPSTRRVAVWRRRGSTVAFFGGRELP